MKTILIILFILFIIVFLILLLSPLIGIGYVLKKSLEKKTPLFLENEKIQMEEKVRELKNDLEDWKKFTINDITNDIEFYYKKSISNKLTGKIFSQDDSPIIAFQRIDRGIHTNSRILACSTDFKVYFEYTQNKNLIYFNDVYLGRIINNSMIMNTSDVKIANYNRFVFKDDNHYSIEFESKKTVNIFKNSDRKNFINNPLYTRPNAVEEFRRHSKRYRETPPSYPLIYTNNEIDGEELKWIIAISIFESVYYGFDFTS